MKPATKANKKPHGRKAFFLVIPLGLEERAQIELTEWTMVLATAFGEEALLYNVEMVKGGIEFEVGEQVGLLLNYVLKLPSRILQRVHSFKTRDWPVVENELRTVNWKSYFPQGVQDFEIAASESRINNEKHLRTFLEEKFEGRHYQKSPQGTVAYLRVHDNQFTLSRDTSGEHLHFRGYRQQQGEAPLRENLAAFLWSMLIKDQSRLNAQEALIIDPFVGSGTVLMEAVLWNQVVSSRTSSIPFASTPWISKESWLRFERVRERLQPWSLSLVGVDSNAEVLGKARANFATKAQGGSVDFVNEDSVSKQNPNWLPKDKPVWLISNPPYGGKGRLKSELSWRALWEGALVRYQPVWAVALGPERECHKGDRLAHWHCVETQRFLNGGLRVVASVWKRQS